jgi:hypothetical protein
MHLFDIVGRMTPPDDLKQFREFLGPAADSYNDAQLAELRREMRMMAELLLDMYWQKKSHGKAPREGGRAFDGSGETP